MDAAAADIARRQDLARAQLLPVQIDPLKDQREAISGLGLGAKVQVIGEHVDELAHHRGAQAGVLHRLPQAAGDLSADDVLARVQRHLELLAAVGPLGLAPRLPDVLRARLVAEGRDLTGGVDLGLPAIAGAAAPEVELLAGGRDDLVDGPVGEPAALERQEDRLVRGELAAQRRRRALLKARRVLALVAGGGALGELDAQRGARRLHARPEQQLRPVHGALRLRAPRRLALRGVGEEQVGGQRREHQADGDDAPPEDPRRRPYPRGWRSRSLTNGSMDTRQLLGGVWLPDASSPAVVVRPGPGGKLQGEASRAEIG